MSISNFIKKLLKVDALFGGDKKKLSGVNDRNVYFSDTDVVYSATNKTITLTNQTTVPSWLSSGKYFRTYDGSKKSTSSSTSATYVADVILTPNVGTNSGVLFKVDRVQNNVIYLDDSENIPVDRDSSTTTVTLDGRIAIVTNDEDKNRINAYGSTVFNLQYENYTGKDDGSGIAINFADHYHDANGGTIVVENVKKIVEEKTCEASAQVGDLVYDSVTDGKVEIATNNSNIKPVFGVIIEKTSSTECMILLQGEVDTSETLSDGKKIFLSTSGSFTSSGPSTDYLQCLGIAVSTSRVYFNPSFERVKRAT